MSIKIVEAGAAGGGLTDTQLRATAVPVSGTVTANIGTSGSLALEATLQSVKTAVETLDNAVSGAGFNITQIGGAAAPIGAGLEITAVRVTLPTNGTGIVGLAAGTNNIGDVDVLTINGVAPAFGTGIRGATVQRVTIATDDSVPVTGTFFQATQPVSGTVAVTGVSTLSEQQTQTTALQLIDDAVYASDAVLGKTIGLAAVFDDVATVAITENQAGYLRMSARRALLIEGVASGTALNVLDTNSAALLTALQLLDNAVSGLGFNITQLGGAAVPIGAGLEATAVRVTLPTDGTGVVKLGAGVAEIGKLAAGVANIGDVDILTIAAGDNNIGNVDVVTVPADPFGVNADVGSTTGSISAKLKFIAATGIPITGTVTVAAHAVTNAGTFAVQSAAAGDTAHDGVDTGNPIKIGGKAISAEPAVVAANDRVNALFDLVGKLIVLPYSNPENFVSGAITTAMAATTSTSLIAAPAAGLRNYITQITVSNSHATVGTDIIIQDGSGGTTLYTIPAAAAYGGATLTFPTPLRQPTTATAIFCANVTTGSSTKVSASGYKGV